MLVKEKEGGGLITNDAVESAPAHLGILSCKLTGKPMLSKPMLSKTIASASICDWSPFFILLTLNCIIGEAGGFG